MQIINIKVYYSYVYMDTNVCIMVSKVYIIRIV